jgi:ABC-type transporter Mla subunit MlaD
MVAYSTRCAQVAAALNDVSQEVNAAGASLRSAGREDLSDTAATLQQHEKEHLRLVATLQVLRKEHAAGRWSWQQAEVSLEGMDPSAIRPAWAIDRGCRVHVDGEAGDGGQAAAAGCQCGAAEPTREEYEAAVREATQALQRTMLAIDDVLGELREAVSDE